MKNIRQILTLVLFFSVAFGLAFIVGKLCFTGMSSDSFYKYIGNEQTEVKEASNWFPQTEYVLKDTSSVKHVASLIISQHLHYERGMQFKLSLVNNKIWAVKDENGILLLLLQTRDCKVLYINDKI